MSTNTDLTSFIHHQLRNLSERIGSRPTGSQNNRSAQAAIARAMTEVGLDVEQQAFECLDWQFSGLELNLDGQALEAFPNPYAPSCDLKAPFLSLSSLEEILSTALEGKIAVLHGNLTAEAYAPKNYPFYSIEEQLAVIRALEEKAPLAVVAISTKEENPPPIFEDGDFLIPSVTVPASTGERLLANAGGTLCLRLESHILPAVGANVIGRKAGSSGRKIVACAHFDTKPGTPGALDNAAGVAAILGLGRLLEGVQLSCGIELIAFNGEDHYSSAGQVQYMQAYGKDFPAISLAINVDGVGWRAARNTVALFECGQETTEMIHSLLPTFPGMIPIDPWYQGDHMLFAKNGTPSLALTSENGESLIDTVIHTGQDTLDLVDSGRVAQAAEFIAAVAKRAV